jgi:hypothetical protein
MKRTLAIVLSLLGSVSVSVSVFAAVGRTEPALREVGPPIGPLMAPDTGGGELLVVVVGGVYPTRAEAEAVNETMPFGDMSGYYVAPVAQFQGFDQDIGSPGDFALVSAFRTEQGALDFVGLARSFEYPARILSARVRSLGGVYTGLGQEASPDGTGPLTHPVPESLP